MLIDIHFLDNQTQERRVYQYPEKMDVDVGVITYMFRDGNYSCDCNRQLFFDRANGIETQEELECGETKFTIEKVVERGTDRIIYKDERP